MERCGSAYILSAFLAVSPFFGAMIGCGHSEADQVAADQNASDDDRGDATTSTGDPTEAGNIVHEFLQAIKTGDEAKSNELLTPLARQKTAELDMAVAPMGSESASFTVGDVELPAEGGGHLAHVASTWTDLDDNGQPHTDEILWVLRREQVGWRIGGMATKVFEDQPPLFLDFEDPSEMRRKQQLVEAEMERRARAAAEELPEESAEAQVVDEPTERSVGDKRQATKPTRQNRNK